MKISNTIDISEISRINEVRNISISSEIRKVIPIKEVR